MAQNQPLVSVLVPTYNGAAFLDETLQGIHAQTHRNLEVIVRDDGSGDDTVQIAEEWAERDHRFRVVTDRVRGGGFANYIALAGLARGQFVKFCNQDDLLAPDCVRALLKPMIGNPRLALSTSSRRLIDADGAELPPRAYTEPLLDRSEMIEGRSVARHVLLAGLNQIGEPSTTLYRARLVRPETMFDFGGVTFPVNCDLALWLSLLERGDLYFHAEPLSSFRIHDAQFSARPQAILDGTLEWVRFLELGLDRGLITPGDRLTAAGGRIAGQLHHQLGAVLGTDDPTLRPYVERLCEGITAASRVATGTTGRVDAPVPAVRAC